jgi:hypothetical protein
MKYQDRLDSEALAQYATWLNARAKAVGAVGTLDATLMRDRILESAGRCEWCNADLVGVGFELDHIVSLKQGGSNEPGNLGVACPSCNRRKARKHPVRFAAEIYSESGQRTKLIALLLETCDVDAGRQMKMFAETPPVIDNSIDIEEDLSPISPYNWTD